ncbi:MAG: VanZ family protein [Acidobacteria bacterium]|nr:VanZ family protein [Acidobacteriota bacterium]
MPRSRLLHHLWIWGPVLLYVGVIFTLSSFSHVPWGNIAPDYISHAVEYFGLSLLMVRALNDGLAQPVPPRRLLITLSLCVACGILDELWQKFVPDRRLADVLDVLSDAAGAGIGLGLVYLTQSYLLSRDPT